MPVELSDVERKQLGQRIQRARSTKFGTKSAAYQAAKINATTWDRIEEGLKVRNDRLSAAVKTLWPESEGDWQRIDEASHPTLSDLIETAESVQYIEVRVDELRQRVETLESRLDRLEEQSAVAGSDCERVTSETESAESNDDDQSPNVTIENRSNAPARNVSKTIRARDRTSDEASQR